MADIGDYSLRPICVDDIEIVRKWRNQDNVKDYMYTDKNITVDEHKAWFKNILKQDDVDYQIIELKNKPIGLANAVEIDPHEKNCHWGFYIGEEESPKGSGSILATLMLNHIFDTHAIDTIYGEVFEFNTASLKLHEKFGFTEIDGSTKTVTKNNKPEKIIVFSLKRDDWDSNELEG